MRDYHYDSCSLTGEECESGGFCDSCDIAKSNEKDESQTQYNSGITFNREVKLNGITLLSNGLNDVIKTDLKTFHKLIELKQKGITENKVPYTLDATSHYPDFMTVKSHYRLGIPDEVYYNPKNIGIAAFVYGDVVYLAAPRLKYEGY